MMERIVVGFKEKVKVYGKNCEEEVMARIDTGAARSSIDVDLAAKLKLGPILMSKIYASVLGKETRPVVKAVIGIKGKKLKATFSVATRDSRRCKVLIGRNILRRGFIIDPLLK